MNEPKQLKDLLENHKFNKSGPHHHWQKLALDFVSDFNIPKKNIPRIMHAFKYHTSTMQEIYHYMKESNNIRNPIAFAFYELKRRRNSNMK